MSISGWFYADNLESQAARSPATATVWRPLTQSKPPSRLPKSVMGDQVGVETRYAKFGPKFADDLMTILQQFFDSRQSYDIVEFTKHL